MTRPIHPTWTCQDCDAGETSKNWAAIDKAAEKHTKATGHATRTEVRGSTRTRRGT